MNLTPEVMIARTKAGYVPPDKQPCVCSKCSAVTRKKDPNMNGCFKYSSRFYCRRHHFYVHSGGYCPAFGTGTFVDPGKPHKPPYKQLELNMT